MRRATWLAAAILAWPLTAVADPYDGYWLRDVCQDATAGQSSFRSGSCVGYILGTMHLWHDSEQTPRLCVGSDVEVGQIVSSVIQSLEALPERQHERAPVLVVTALLTAFPCP